MDKIVPVAVRSLQCIDHSEHIPPRVLSILWHLGKRCNYDCSYCSPHTHDAISPFINLDHAKTFLHRIDQECLDQGRTIKWAFTGGEPFFDPSFLSILQCVSQLGTSSQINAVTNGSCALELYQSAAQLLAGLTFSLHLERTAKELDITIQKIVAIKDCYVSVNLMFVPGHLTQVIEISQLLAQHKIPVITRKIIPPVPGQEALPYVIAGEGRKDRVLYGSIEQESAKVRWRQIRDSNKTRSAAEIYDHQELAYLKQTNQEVVWNNCGVWQIDGAYTEINSDWLVGQDLNTFLGWTCWAGVDHVYIDHDGKLYRGMCLNGGSIGSLSDSGPVFATQPTVCERQWCYCNADIPVRKAKPGYHHHVSA